jgi:hypothetical protein
MMIESMILLNRVDVIINRTARRNLHYCYFIIVNLTLRDTYRDKSGLSSNFATSLLTLLRMKFISKDKNNIKNVKEQVK